MYLEDQYYLCTSQNEVLWLLVYPTTGYARLCNLRLDPTAQKEIRDYATAIDGLMREAFPVSWEALADKFKGNLKTD